MSLCPSYVCVTNKLATCRPMWYSSLTALPPNTSCSLVVVSNCSNLQLRMVLLRKELRATPGNTHILEFTNARSQFCLLIIEIISGAALPSSFNLPTW